MEKFWLKESIQSMRLKIESLKTLDDQIIELIASETTEGVEKRIEKEIENSDSVRAELNEIVMRIEEMMSKFESLPSLVQPSTAPSAQVHSNMASGIPQQSKAKARLPKLEVRKFNGKVQEWQEFWDAFESAIDQNESLTAVDKFAYLRSLVTEPARSTIAGFSLTEVNYAAAVDVLKKKYGKETAIQRAHVNDLLNLAPVFSDKDTTRLRKLYDICSAHFRGLRALGVDKTTFAAVVVPAVLQKMPEAFRLTITRGADFLNWTMEELLSAFLKELELREITDQRLSFDEMLTVLVEVEGTLNARPLTYDDNNPSEEVLTPSHLIHGRRIHSLPEVLESEEEFGESSAMYTRRHKYMTKKLQHFWKRWQWEYLTALRESHKNKTAGKGRSLRKEMLW